VQARLNREKGDPMQRAQTDRRRRELPAGFAIALLVLAEIACLAILLIAL
jgi:hypothetical protein